MTVLFTCLPPAFGTSLESGVGGDAMILEKWSPVLNAWFRQK